MGLSAGFNQLDDLTIDDNYADICGFTHDELDSCFKDYMPVTLDKLKAEGEMPLEADVSDLREEILNWYDGYSWDGKTKVLNPWSILKFFKKCFFSDFWLGTAPTASFLTGFLKKDPFILLDNKFEGYSLNNLGLAEVGQLKPVPALFQTGFLTLDKKHFTKAQGRFYSLKVPNSEVKRINSEIFPDLMFSLWEKDPAKEQDQFKAAIKARDAKKLEEIFDFIFGDLPSRHHEDSESFYHSVLFGYCKKLDRFTIAEHQQAIGIPDIIMIFPVDKLYAVMELKFSADLGTQNQEEALTNLAKNALKAIETKDYAVPWKAPAQDLVKIGIGLSHRGKCLVLFGD
jgi:hypothetical protein